MGDGDEKGHEKGDERGDERGGWSTLLESNDDDVERRNKK
jgi:hypothetical protein